MAMRLVGLTLLAGCLTFPAPAPATGDATVGSDATVAAANVAFVTSNVYLPATLGSDLSGADADCMASARAGRLAGNYVAYLSTSMIDPLTRLSLWRGWVRVDGQPFVDLPEDLGGGKIFTPLSIDEHGADIGMANVITAVTPTAMPLPACSDFTSGSGSVNVGASNATTGAGLAAGAATCITAGHLYCFGTGAVTHVVPPAIPGARHAFMTSSPYVIDSSGLATADALCMSEAGAVPLQGTFKALLPTSTASAISRFSTMGSTWVRLDNVALAPSAFDFASISTAPLNLTSTKQYVSGLVATGGVAPNTKATDATDTCGDWADGSGTLTPGYSSFVNRYFFGVGAMCGGYPINCLEE